MERRLSVRIPAPASVALGGASIAASGAISADPRIADALAMREDFFAVGVDLWAAIDAFETEARRDKQGRLFEPESV